MDRDAAVDALVKAAKYTLECLDEIPEWVHQAGVDASCGKSLLRTALADLVVARGDTKERRR